MSNPHLFPYDGRPVPFRVRLADPGTSFHDLASGLDLFNIEERVCDNLTPQTRDWLRTGAILLIQEDDEQGSEEGQETSNQEGPGDHAGEPSGASEGSGESGVEDGGQEETEEGATEEEEEQEETEQEGAEQETGSGDLSLDELMNATTTPKKVKRNR